ncbi:hypothetical protein PI124_g4987 [Phytophthora idaei]|nr:hypothetical protein PI125_g23022 [Phytophthora idaei]KAG3164948.1 hypothetical protein PI126_g4856 [Phytophthora idaei]KAG3250371.1 hypothetical protein PI124_g4987 [Phytophthora idaei]
MQRRVTEGTSAPTSYRRHRRPRTSPNFENPVQPMSLSFEILTPKLTGATAGCATYGVGTCGCGGLRGGAVGAVVGIRAPSDPILIRRPRAQMKAVNALDP